MTEKYIIVESRVRPGEIFDVYQQFPTNKSDTKGGICLIECRGTFTTREEAEKYLEWLKQDNENSDPR